MDTRGRLPSAKQAYIVTPTSSRAFHSMLQRLTARHNLPPTIKHDQNQLRADDGQLTGGAS